MITLLLHQLRLLHFSAAAIAISPSRTWPCPTRRRTAPRPKLPYDGSPLLGRAGQGLDRVAAVPRDRNPRDRSAVAAAPLPRALAPALRPAHRGPTARQYRDHRPGQENAANPLWAALESGELLKLGIDVAERSLLLTRAQEARRLPAERREIIGVESAKRHYVQGAKGPRV
jgi:hypothetical protein